MTRALWLRGFLLFLLLLLMAAGAGRSLGQNQVEAGPLSDDWVVRSWQTKDGLPQNTPNAILQSRDGYLWVGTSGGLARFDGVRFRSFGLADGLRSVQVFRLCEDQAGVLWVGTVGGGLSRWENGRFVTFGQAEGFPAAVVQTLAAHRDGSLWIGTDSGLVRWQNGVFKSMGAAEGLPPGSQVRALAIDDKGVVWVSVLPDGLYRGSNGQFSRAGEPGKPVPGGVYSLMADRDGSVWAGSFGQLWNGRDGNWTRYGATNGIPQAVVQSLDQNKDGSLWLGARGSGLYGFKDGQARPVSGDPDRAIGSASGLLVDREGMVWCGTVGDGLSRLSRRVVRHWGKADGLTPSVLTTVAEDTAGGLWVGTQDNGVWRFLDGRFSRWTDPVVAGRFPHVYTMAAARDGSVWTGGEQFLLRYHPGQTTAAFLEPAIRREAIRALCVDGTNVWLGTYYSTLLKVSGTNVEVVATNGTFAGTITSLELGAPGELWIGTSERLYLRERGGLKSWGTGDGLVASNIQALRRDADGTLWIGTLGGGLARLKNGRISNLTMRHGLVDDVISQIVADDSGHLWLGCNRGIMSLMRREIDDVAEGRATWVHPMVLGANDGILNEQCSAGHSPTVLKTRDGRLMFPTMDGLVEVDPRRVNAQSALTATHPRAIIEEVLLDDALQGRDGTLMVPAGGHRLEVRYTAPTLFGGEQVRFRTRLEGLDPDWVMAGTRRSVTYVGLPPGGYVFHVSASDARGTWDERSASFTVLMNPRFWQTLWFGVLMVVMAVGLAWAWFRQHVGKLDMRRREQEDFTRQLIGAQEGERARLARELHDDITQRLALLAIDAGRVEQAGPGIDAGQTMRGVREGLVRLSEDVHTLSYRLHSSLLEDLGLAEALRAECERFSRQESIGGELKLVDLPLVIPKDIALGLFRIAQEALRNVARHARAKRVVVTLRALENGLQLTIDDNGIGFDPLRKRETISLGLASMRERVGLLGGELDIESAPGEGTNIVAWVPVEGEGRK